MKKTLTDKDILVAVEGQKNPKAILYISGFVVAYILLGIVYGILRNFTTPSYILLFSGLVVAGVLIWRCQIQRQRDIVSVQNGEFCVVEDSVKDVVERVAEKGVPKYHITLTDSQYEFDSEEPHEKGDGIYIVIISRRKNLYIHPNVYPTKTYNYVGSYQFQDNAK